jgi:hypothetical protein
MTIGRTAAQVWMTEFLRLWNLSTVPEPRRAFFDTEVYAFESGPAGPLLFHAMSKDSRWSSEDVPGFGLLSSGLRPTMQNLWNDACAQFNLPHWTTAMPGNNFTINNIQTLRLNQPLTQYTAHWFFPTDNENYKIHNGEYLAWYQSIAYRAVDAAMKQAAYDPIRSAWGAMDVKTSNYNHMNLASAGTMSLPWHQDPERFGNLNSNPGSPADNWWTKSSELGKWEAQPNSNFDLYRSLINDYLPTGDRYLLRRDEKASGDFSSPFLYDFGNIRIEDTITGTPSDTGNMIFYRQRNPFLPGRPLYDDSYRWDIALRENRRTIEAIIQSPGNNLSPWNQIVPWVGLAGTRFGDSTGETAYEPDDIDVGLNLAMLREKQIPEFIGFDNFVKRSATVDANGDTVYGDSEQAIDAEALMDAYKRFNGLYHDVYDPQIKSLVTEGGCTGSGVSHWNDAMNVCETVVDDGFGSEALSLNRLTNTNDSQMIHSLNCPECPPVLTAPTVVSIDSSAITTSHPTAMTAMTVTFNDVRVPRPQSTTYVGDTIRFQVAGSVRTSNTASNPLSDFINTDVYIYDWGIGEWRPVAIGDRCDSGDPELCPPVLFGFGFWAPIETLSNGDRQIDFRRTFDISVLQPGDPEISQVVKDLNGDGEGEVVIKFITYGGVPFTMDYDLLQLQTIPETATQHVPSNVPRHRLRPRLGIDNNLCQIDVDYNGEYTLDDFNLYLARFADNNLAADINLDNAVNIVDLAEFIQTWCN